MQIARLRISATRCEQMQHRIDVVRAQIGVDFAKTGIMVEIQAVAVTDVHDWSPPSGSAVP